MTQFLGPNDENDKVRWINNEATAAARHRSSIATAINQFDVVLAVLDQLNEEVERLNRFVGNAVGMTTDESAQKAMMKVGHIGGSIGFQKKSAHDGKAEMERYGRGF